MSSFFSLLRTAILFYRKQPVLNLVMFWFLFVPTTALDLLSQFAGIAVAQDGTANVNDISAAIAIVVLVFLIYFGVWGQACILLIGKRMISSPAGRTRTSFKAVRSQSRKYIGPLLLTMVLRSVIGSLLCAGVLIALILEPKIDVVTFTILATLGLLPGIVYMLRTVFFSVIIVTGKSQYFAALKESSQIVGHRVLRTLFTLLGFFFLAAIPMSLGLLLATFLIDLSPQTELLAKIITNGLSSVLMTLFLIFLVAFYKEMKATSV